MTGVGERGADAASDATLNLRDLGGRPTRGGLAVVSGRFFRSADPASCGASDVLLPLGLRTAIDLRTSAEREARDTAFALPDCQHSHHPLFETARPNWLGTPEQTPKATAMRYLEMLHDGAPALATIVTELSRRAADPFVIHCAAGRDRTGIAVACLLDLLDVTDDAIAADYALSDTFAHDGGRAHAGTMLEFLALGRARHGSIEEILRGRGMADGVVSKLSSELLRREGDVELAGAVLT
jgi:hypothetical protein